MQTHHISSNNQILKIKDNNKIVSVNELNEVLALAKKDNSQHIEIQFTKPIEKIDIVFIAGLILYNRQFLTKFSIFYPNELEESKIFEVRQYLRQFEKIFMQPWTTAFNKIKRISNLKDTDYVSSGSFAPIILINNDSIKTFFNTNISETGGELLNLCQKYLTQKSKERKKKEQKYLDSGESITKLLDSYPPIHTFVFTVLYNTISPFVSCKDKGIENPIQRTEELWEFVKAYVKGLYELAKNIVEHSSTGEGIVTIRAYDKEEQEGENKDKVLETHVFDFGENGIIQKLLADTEKKKNEHNIYEEDLKILKDSFCLEDFIKPSPVKKLNQQVRRELAHYGLLKFYKLIEKNEGTVGSSTTTKKDGDRVRDVYPSAYNKALILGTSYFFQLPFKPELFKVTDHVLHKSNMQGSLTTISGLSALMKLKVISDFPKNGDNEENILFDFKPSVTVIDNRDDESTLCNLFPDLKTSKIKYLAINMKDMTMSASSLLRFLAHLSTEYSQAIIIYNLNFTLYDEMIEDNKEFYKSLTDLESIPFWYEDKGLLVFSKLKEIDFTFADVLFGQSEKEFEEVNHLISHTFANTLSIIKGKLENGGFQIPDCLMPFFYQKALLPFDLLLFDNQNKTLFQSNLEILLNTEIKKRHVEG